MKSVKFRFRLRTLMAVVMLAAVESAWLAENRLVSEWQQAVMRGETQVTADTDGDGRVDTIFMQYANKQWAKIDLPRQ